MEQQHYSSPSKCFKVGFQVVEHFLHLHTANNHYDHPRHCSGNLAVVFCHQTWAYCYNTNTSSLNHTLHCRTQRHQGNTLHEITQRILLTRIAGHKTSTSPTRSQGPPIRRIPFRARRHRSRPRESHRLAQAVRPCISHQDRRNRLHLALLTPSRKRPHGQEIQHLLFSRPSPHGSRRFVSGPPPTLHAIRAQMA